MASTNRPDAGKMRFVATGLAGSLLVNLSAQFVSVNASDIQGGVFASADEAASDPRLVQDAVAPGRWLR